MSLLIHPKDLKTSAKLTSQIKVISESAGKKYAWNMVHRLRSTGDRLVLCTTDGSNFLEWGIPLRNSGAEEIDALVPADLFNAMADNSNEGAYFIVKQESSFLHFQQDQRALRLELKQYGAYPTPPESIVAVRTCTTGAAHLAKGLEFAIPFIDAENEHPGRSVLTWKTDGSLVTGQPKHFAIAKGLSAPPVTMNLNRQAAGALKAFLTRVGGDVEVAASGTIYSFTSLQLGHRLLLLGGTTEFQGKLDDINDPDAETWKIDLQALLNSLAILGSVIPARANRVDVLVRGQGEVASIRLTTPGTEEIRSTDEFAIIRKHVDPATGEESNQPPDTAFMINCRTFLWALSRLKAVTLEVKYFPGRRLLLFGEADQGSGEGPVRSLLLTVQKPKGSGPNQVIENPGAGDQPPDSRPNPAIPTTDDETSGKPETQAIEASESGDHPPESQPKPTTATSDGETPGKPESNGAKPSTSKK